MYSKELRDQVIRYIDNEISLHDLEEWLVPRMHRFIQNPDSDDADLIAEIELQLAEYSDGLRDEGQVRQEMKSFLAFIKAYYPEKPKSYSETRASTRFEKYTWTIEPDQRVTIESVSIGPY